MSDPAPPRRQRDRLPDLPLGERRASVLLGSLVFAAVLFSVLLVLDEGPSLGGPWAVLRYAVDAPVAWVLAALGGLSGAGLLAFAAHRAQEVAVRRISWCVALGVVGVLNALLWLAAAVV